MAREILVDKIETIEGSVVQHGHHNHRIYVMHLKSRDTENLISKLDAMAIGQGYEKIFAKIPATRWKAFKSADYTKEAVIPGFFKGESDCLFIAKFFSAERQMGTRQVRFDRMERISSSGPLTNNTDPPIVACTPADAEVLGKIYRQAFESYPFPIHQPEYLKQMMEKGSLYFCIHVNKQIAAVAAAEIDSANQVCEMTDFATRPEYRGKGFAGKLLGRLDHAARNYGLKTAYTIARADSRGMNQVFRKMGYRYAGLLAKNSQIGGRIRSMKVWYKRL